ncbi:hypothetical protein ACLB2K_057312 [Fragaria x ananassa]
MVNLLAPILVCPLVAMAITYRNMQSKLEEVKRFDETLDMSLLIMHRAGIEKNQAETMRNKMAEMEKTIAEMEKKMAEMMEKKMPGMVEKKLPLVVALQPRAQK